MPLHTVTKHGSTKAGKPVVYFDNQHGYKDMIFLGKTAPPPIGVLIDTEMSSLPRDDGSQTWFLNKWGVMPQDSQPQKFVEPEAPKGVWKASPVNPVNAMPAMPDKQISSPAGYSDGERLFMSNIVAAAIQAGRVQDPVDLLAWTQAALQALRNSVEQNFEAF